MGVVFKQSFWSSIWAYSGVAIGYVNTLILLPLAMSLDEIGLFRLVVSNALLLAPFVSVGMPGTYVKYFAHLEEDEALDRKFFSFQLFLILFMNLLVGLITLVFSDWIEVYFLDQAPDYTQYIFISFLILLTQTLYQQLHSYSRVRLDVIFPNFLKEVYLRLGNVIVISLFALDQIDFQQTVQSLVIVYGSSVLWQIIFLVRTHAIKFTWKFLHLPQKWFLKMLNFGGYSLLLAGSNSIYGNVSFAMIASTLGTGLNGVYSTCFFIGIIIEMPKRVMLQITSPIVSRSFKNDRLDEIKSLYKKVSLTLGSIALLFFLGISLNLEDLFQIMPKGDQFRVGIWVVYAVSISKVIDMLFSIGSNILIYSKYYRYNLYFFIPCAISVVLVNYLLLPLYGINGAGLAFLFSTIIFNLTKFVFVKWKFGLTPFTRKHPTLIGLALAVYLIFWFLPLAFAPIINIILRSGLIALVFVVMLYVLNISSDINEQLRKTIKKYLNITLP